MRVLVTGADGQLGRALSLSFAGVASNHVVAADRDRLDITDREAVLSALSTIRPAVVINTAAFTDVDGAEVDTDSAMRLNALAVRHLADGCRLADSHLVQISTDMVFGGEKSTPYDEWDTPRPISEYGRSKLGGEREVPPGHLIIRTSWLSGAHGSNIVRTVLRLAEGDGPLRFVDDRLGNPTFVDDLADAIRRLASARATGIFHVTHQRAVSPYELAREVLTAAGHDPDRVVPVPSSEEPGNRLAPRPANSVLDNAALRLQGWPLLPDHQEPLERLVKELNK